MDSKKTRRSIEGQDVYTFIFTLLFAIGASSGEGSATTNASTTESEPKTRCRLIINGFLHVLTPEKFEQAACALCYYYNPSMQDRPPKYNASTPWSNRWQLRWIDTLWLANPDNSSEVVPARADAALGPELALHEEERAKWSQCCTAARRCCQETITTHWESNSPHSAQGTCPSVWGGWNCWLETPAGTTANGHCPSYIQYSSNPCGVTQRTCYVNGTWERLTDYRVCALYDENRRSIKELVAEYAVSILFLIPALAILFLLYRHAVHGHRISLHRNLFASLLFHAGMEVVYRLAVVLPNVELMKNNGTSQGGVWCICVFVASKYFRCSSFMWMFCEGFYLHRQLAAAFSPEASITIFYLIGWGLPLLPTALYTFLRANAGHGHCWMRMSQFEWVFIVPNVLSLVANMVFLVSILRVLTQLKRPSQDEPSNYRRAVRATLLLVPLLGLHFVVTLYRPPQGHCRWRRVHEIMDHALDGLQGAVVACLFCFCNSEIHELLRRARRTLVERYQPGLRPSLGSHSFSTAVTPASAQASRNV